MADLTQTQGPNAANTVLPGGSGNTGGANFTVGGSSDPAVASSVPASTTITSSVLAPATPLQYTTANPTPIPSVSSLETMSTPALTATPEEQEETNLDTSIAGLNNSMVGKSAYQTAQDTAAGVDTLTDQQRDLSTQVSQLKNEALAIPQQLQLDATGRGITSDGLAPIQTAALRNNSIQALTASSLLDATNGLLASAQTKADKAVAAKYDPIQEQINAASANLNRIKNDPQTSLDDKNRAQAQLDAQNAKQAQLDTAKQNAKDVLSAAQTAAQNGADALTLQKIQAAPDGATALQIATAAGYGNSNVNDLITKYPDAGIQPGDTLQQAQQKIIASPSYTASQKATLLDNAYKQAQTSKLYSDMAAANLAGADASTVAGWVTSIKSGQAKLSDITGQPALKNAVTTALSTSGSTTASILDTTKTSLQELQTMVDQNHGFTSAVGTNVPNPLGILTDPLDQVGFKGLPGTQSADFEAKLNQVKNDVVLPNLTLLHGLGRVTDREFQALSSALTSLSPNLSEGQFKSELADLTTQISKIATTDDSSTTYNGIQLPTDDSDNSIGGIKLPH